MPAFQIKIVIVKNYFEHTVADKDHPLVQNCKTFIVSIWFQSLTESEIAMLDASTCTAQTAQTNDDSWFMDTLDSDSEEPVPRFHSTPLKATHNDETVQAGIQPLSTNTLILSEFTM